MAAQNAPAAAEGNRVASDARGGIADASATAAGVAVEGRSDGRAVNEMKAEAAAMPQLQGEDQARPAEPAPASKAVAVNAGREELRLAQRAALAERELSPTQAVQMLSNRGSGAFETRHLEGLFFSLVGDYWIDGRCAGQRDSGIIETVQGSSEAREIMASIPLVADLLQGGRRVIIQHAGKLYLLPKPQTPNRNQQNQDR
jgi:hemin uptake protein HemP